MKLFRIALFTPIAGLCLSLMTVDNAQATNLYFGSTGGITSGGTYSWDAANWGNASTGPFTSTWTNGDFARLYSTANYTITVNADESMAGLFQSSAVNNT